ncbi:hypothetical protein [Bdellovibrio sp. GT3]|uniref:hypothetical protein n=1 Tax=Bdellovibrio sp. GT3 TaxID=3136282 RepID=UPI0030F0AD66
MERILNALLFSIISMAAAAAIGAQGQSPQKPAGEGNELLRCIYTSQADQQSSSLATVKLGFKFLLQRNNDNHIAVDTYTLNDSSQLVKQISHAEVISSVAAIKSTTKASDLVSGLTLAEDSPFDFQIALDSSASDSNGRFSAVVGTVTTFAGEVYSNLSVNCRLPPAAISPQALSPSQSQTQSLPLN